LGNIIRAGEYLDVEGQIRSKNGQFTALVQENNNFNVFRKGTGNVWEFLWSSNTTKNWVSKLCLEWTGRLVLYGAGSKALWTQGTPSSIGQAELLLQDDGNLVLSRGGSTMWQTEISVSSQTLLLIGLLWLMWKCSFHYLLQALPQTSLHAVNGYRLIKL
jgi:hypothetical protein